MAELVGVFAASHGPLIARDWQTIPAMLRTRLQAGFDAVGERLAACAPDVLIIISPDHWVNFFLNNLPAVCIGVGETHDGPPEPFMRDFPHRQIAGHPGFALHLAQTALEGGFDPALSHHLVLDHGFCIPLLRMALARLPAVVPIVVNDLEPPMPGLRRCLQWGALLREAIESHPSDLRVAVLGTGGLSHSIGEKTMGVVDESFDRACLERFAAGTPDALADWLHTSLEHTGNGAHEVRDWLVAHGAAGGRGFELLDYFPAPEVYIGAAFAAWNLV
jgi:aromatic ring-opening dioxygenase catalytic subunit (LigB family)